MNLTPEERAIGQENYYRAVTAHDHMTRRGFMAHVAAAGVATSAGLGGMYFGYGRPNNPVRIGIIGTGDEGGILIGGLNPDYVEVVAIADIRPSSIHRAFHGDWGGGNPARTHALRPGLMQIYDWKSEDEARQHVKVYDPKSGTDYHDLLKNPDVEAVIIALPLHLHATCAVEAMQNGKHVLTEKLMAHNIAQCKVMSRVADATYKHLATGHQRHYSILYDNAVNLIRWGLLGQLHYIRAQWHRGNVPGNDSWSPPLPGGENPLNYPGAPRGRIDPIKDQLVKFQQRKAELDRLKASGSTIDKAEYEMLLRQVAQWTQWDDDKSIAADKYGYEHKQLTIRKQEYHRSALEELIRWRIWDRTGGGLMAELGSHQLDAASIFISALSNEHVHPLTVHAVGGRHIFPADRDADDHVYCTFEFPAPGYEPQFNPGYRDKVIGVPDPQHGIESYEEDSQKKIVVTYSSINGNGFGGYGEIVMGTKGTLILDREQEVMLYKDSDTSSKIGVKDDKGGPVLDTQESGPMGPAKAAEETGPVSRGYAEEIEHWAWCIRQNPDARNPDVRPRCHPEVAVGDAVIALTAKVAANNSQTTKGGYLAFQKEWFDIARPETPDESSVDKQIAELKANISKS